MCGPIECGGDAIGRDSQSRRRDRRSREQAEGRAPCGGEHHVPGPTTNDDRSPRRHRGHRGFTSSQGHTAEATAAESRAGAPRTDGGTDEDDGPDRTNRAAVFHENTGDFGDVAKAVVLLLVLGLLAYLFLVVL